MPECPNSYANVKKFFPHVKFHNQIIRTAKSAKEREERPRRTKSALRGTSRYFAISRLYSLFFVRTSRCFAPSCRIFARHSKTNPAARLTKSVSRKIRLRELPISVEYDRSSRSTARPWARRPCHDHS